MSALARYEGKVPMKAYFAHVAHNLLANLGPEALPMADRALVKMRATDNHMGFEMWLGIQEALTIKLGAQARAVIH